MSRGEESWRPATLDLVGTRVGPYHLEAVSSRPRRAERAALGSVETLRSRMARGATAPGEAIALVLGLAREVAAAHARGVRSCDVHPQHVLVSSLGAVQLLELAVSDDEAAGYRAPERERGERGEPSGDLFALGAILVELVTGRPAFPGASPGERLLRVLREPPAGVERLGALAPIAARCLAKDPARRLRSADDLVFVLERARRA
jgi:serine/threonine protein kinase